MTLLQMHTAVTKFKLGWFAYASLYGLLGLVTIILCTTFWPAQPPFIDVTGNAVATRRGNIIQVRIQRDATIVKNADAIVYRKAVHNETGIQYDLSYSFRAFKKGTFNMDTMLMMPIGMPDGQYTLSTVVLWHPPLSLIEHVSSPPNLHFTVCGKEIDCVAK